MKIQIQNIQGREHIVPAGKFYDGDWFKCQNCGNTIRMKVLGNYATWRATNNSDSFDLKTFEVRGRPVKPVPGLRPGMSVIFAWPFDPVMEDGH